MKHALLMFSETGQNGLAKTVKRINAGFHKHSQVRKPLIR